MIRKETIRAAALIVLPFMLLPGAFWLAVNAPGPVPASGWQPGVIWALRAIYFVGAIIGWRAGRPHWFYPWLGFAVYAAVAILLQITFLFTGWGDGPLMILLGLILLPAAFAPYYAAALWLGWRRSQRQLAAYTVFPHAGLTIPLFILVTGGQSPGDLSGVFLSAVAGAAIATLYWYPLSRFAQGETNWIRTAVLYGGVILTHTLFFIGLGYLDDVGRVRDILVMLIALVGLGWLILSGPFLLPPLVQWLIRVLRAGGTAGSIRIKVGRIWPDLTGEKTRISDSLGLLRSEDAGGLSPKGEVNMSEANVESVLPDTRQTAGPNLDRLYKLSITILAALAVILVALYVGRAAVYKIHEFERGLHLRGGRFLGVQMPGWHIQVPLVDTVIIVKVNERLGYVERIAAMTSDNVTMDVSLQYTYRVTDPERFALAVDDPERIVFEFVQGRLRDVINTKAMTGVMNQRTEMNLEIMQELEEKEGQYGVEFITVQIQSASPPTEVLSAIKDRMVAVQRQEQAEAEAAQQRTVADAQFYAAQKEAEAHAYRITTTAAAEAEQIQLTTEAQQLAVRAILSELEGKGALAEKYIDYLIAVELKENSKWILGAGAEPILELRPSVEE